MDIIPEDQPIAPINPYACDGFCTCNYVHVSDLASAHVAALDDLRAGGANLTLNCGYGRGFSGRKSWTWLSGCPVWISP